MGRVFQYILIPRPNGSQKKKLENRLTLASTALEASWAVQKNLCEVLHSCKI